MNPQTASVRPRRRVLGSSRVLAAALAVALAACARSAGYDRPIATRATPAPTLARGLFAADLIVARQDALGLAPAQRAAIASELAHGRAELAPLDGPLRDARDALATALQGAHVDEATALALATRVTALEAQVKLAHLRLLVRLKNVLTPAQQARLASDEPAREAGVAPEGGL